MAKKQKSDGGGIDPNAWMVTFGDLITLLLTFFVLLLTMSSMDSQKLEDISSASSGNYMDVLDEAKMAGDRPFEMVTVDITRLIRNQLQMMKKSSFKTVRAEDDPNKLHPQTGEKQGEGLVPDSDNTTDPPSPSVIPWIDIIESKTGHKIRLSAQKNGILITLPHRAAFEPDSLRLTPAAKDVIDTVVAVAEATGLSLSIFGHTARDTTIPSKYHDAWAYSSAKSAAIAHYIESSEEHEAIADRLRVAGFADSRPVSSNRTEKGRYHNDRVELWLEPLSNWAEAQVAGFPIFPDPSGYDTNAADPPTLFPEDAVKTPDPLFQDLDKKFDVF